VILAFAGFIEVSNAAPPPAVPEGFTIELVAGYPLVEHPMMGNFDDQGRLYVCESAGTNRPAAELLADPLDSIRVLEDTDGDGVFDNSWTFADKLVFPQGCLWLDGSVYTCSPPSLWKLDDTDGDGVCDQRTELVKTFGFNGNAADIHGPFLSPNGRLFWCDGRHGHEFFDENGNLVSEGKAARIFSCLPDGSDVRVLCGGGMDNPVEVDFWPTGEVIGTCNLFYADPRGDCLVHWVHGGVYPRVDQQDCIAEFPWTGGLLDPIHNYGHVAVAGMTRYRGDSLVDRAPDANQELFFVTHFNTHRVVRTVVERSGATFRVADTADFMVSEDPDCHPTDVIECADGSLLVIDTGGWFRIGCPTSQIAKPEIAGAIYRIRRDSSQPIEPAVIADAQPTETEMIIGMPAHEVMRELQEISDGTSPVVGTLDEVTVMWEVLHDGEPHPVIDHAVIRALITIDNPATTREGLSANHPRQQRAALIALDQMKSGDLTRDDVLPLLDTEDAALQQAVLEVISRREGWSDGVVATMQEWLTAEQVEEARLAIIRRFLTSRASEEAVQSLVASSIGSDGLAEPSRQALLEVMEAADVEAWPEAWSGPLTAILASPSEAERLMGVRIVAAQQLSQFDDRLLALLNDANETAPVRVDAFAAVAPRLTSLDTTTGGFLRGRLKSEEASLSEKVRIAQAFCEVNGLTNCQYAGLANYLDEFGPVAAAACLPVFEGTSKYGEFLVESLEALGTTLPVSPEELERTLAGYPQEIRDRAAPLIEQLRQAGAEQAQRVDELTAACVDGNPDRGKYVFFSQRAACASCHRVQGEGTLVGPDLSTIGASRQTRDLVESIVFPSSSFARGYEPFLVATAEGHIHTGIITRETTDTVTLRTTDLREVRVRRDEIDALQPSDTSIMPKGLEGRLTEEELRDLVAFLQNLK
jgi:putative membrane-bound dehydrogenase-like protein